MIFEIFFAFVLVVCDAKPGYSGSSNAENELGHGTNTAGAGGNAYGYSGSFSGDGGFPAGNIPSFVPFIPQFDFSSFFDQLNRQHQEFIQHYGGGVVSYSHASSGPGSSAQAQSSIVFDSMPTTGIQSLAQAQAQAGSSAGTGNVGSGYQGSQGPAASGAGYGSGIDLGNRGGFVGGYGGGFGGPDGNSFSFSGPLGDSGSAIASGSIGPTGVHQTASVFPENPNAPNVNTRFGGESSGGDGGGFKSVFTSSKSVSSNVDGKPQTFRQASTTVNDNGKVTTYTAHNP
ncbi:keratin, type I cytoskeletal 9 isoform X1 [Dendroctonus ponderosae]